MAVAYCHAARGVAVRAGSRIKKSAAVAYYHMPRARGAVLLLGELTELNTMREGYYMSDEPSLII